MALALYNFPQSTCSQKVRFCIAEKELEWEDLRLDPLQEDHLKPWYLELNPNGVVPTLVHNDVAIADSSTIMEYLDEVFPEPRLLPETAVERAHARKWLRYFEEVPTVAIRYPSFQYHFIRRFQALDDTELSAAADKRPLRTDFYRRMGRTGFTDAEMQASFDKLKQAAHRVDSAIVKNGGTWIMGHQLTLADACYLPIVDRMETLGLHTIWSDLPALKFWYEAIKARPSYASAFYEGSRINVNLSSLPSGIVAPQDS
jgi:glutathione S-transferase